VFQLERTTFIYWLIECTPKAWFVRVFQLERTIFIYQLIECSPKAWWKGALTWKNYFHLLANAIQNLYL
jgi:hypothetical protein